MSTAVFLIVFVAFAVRLIVSAAALRNVALAIGLTVLAAGIYYVTPLGFARRIPVVVLDVVMLLLGFAIPTMLMNAESKGRGPRAAAFFIGLLATIAAADVWRVTAVLPVSFYLAPTTWFATGAACFLIFKARFFEDVLEA